MPCEGEKKRERLGRRPDLYLKGPWKQERVECVFGKFLRDLETGGEKAGGWGGVLRGGGKKWSGQKKGTLSIVQLIFL